MPHEIDDSSFWTLRDSKSGLLYNVRSSPDLTGDIVTWTLVEGDIPASGTGTNTKSVSPPEAVLFCRVEEFPPPPPPPLFEENFDGVVAPALPTGWTTTGAGTTAWEIPPADQAPPPPEAAPTASAPTSSATTPPPPMSR